MFGRRPALVDALGAPVGGEAGGAHMSREVSRAYDSVAELYASLFIDEVDRDPNARKWLARFAELAGVLDGVVLDLGCGPGHVVDHLCGLGVAAVGYDFAPGQIEQARARFPEHEFHVGDMGALEADDASVAGIVSRYSIIHVEPGRLGVIFREWHRALAPSAPLLISFFGALSPESHGAPFDHKVTTAYELCPQLVAEELSAAGLDPIEVDTQPASPDSLRPFDQATILARRQAD